MKMPVMKVQGSSYPDYIERDTSFKINEKIIIQYDWAEKESCMNGYKKNWHKDKGVFTVADILCNMLVNPCETTIRLHSEDKVFKERCNCDEFDVSEDLLIKRLCN